MIVPQNKTFYIGKKVFRAGDEIPDNIYVPGITVVVQKPEKKERKKYERSY